MTEHSTFKTFDDLWNACEQLHQETDQDNQTNTAVLMEELLLKINLYKALDARTEMSEEDRQNIKSRTLGEVLLTLTHISLIDNINVFEALNMALQYRIKLPV
jgi:hypothetical protein